jgi:hypothetical protein
MTDEIYILLSITLMAALGVLVYVDQDVKKMIARKPRDKKDKFNG